jgi:hypothetical protein
MRPIERMKFVHAAHASVAFDGAIRVAFSKSRIAQKRRSKTHAAANKYAADRPLQSWASRYP